MGDEFLGGASRSAMRLALIGAAALMMAGCSSDMTRFGDGAAPVRPHADLSPTASIRSPEQMAQATSGAYSPSAGATTSRIVSTPLSAPNPKYAAAATPSPALNRQAVAAPASTSSLSSGTGGWKADGGTSIVVAQGESASLLATRYGVPLPALLGVNGLQSPSQVQPGARLIVPVYGGGARAVSSVKAPAAKVVEARAPARVFETKPARTAESKPTAHETMRLVKGPEAAKVAAEKHASAKTAPDRLAKGAKPIVEPKATKPIVAERVQPAPAKLGKIAKLETPKHDAAAREQHPVIQPTSREAIASPAPQTLAKTKGAPAPDIDRDTKTASLPPPAASAPAADADKPEFRWPARGRVIQGFKPGGNDGINIALPEGTSVKAAEGGVVAYAGSELKGYGNLVLIRHPNGFVSAYANNGDLSVKRGQTVTRGQVIAKSGQSGNVASPQLHFELRKGATPVDPTNYLAGL